MPPYIFGLFTIIYNNLNFREEKVIHNDMKPTRTALITWGFARFITFASVSIFYLHIFLYSVLFYRLWYV